MEITKLYKQIQKTLKKKSAENTLPSSCYFINEDDVLSLPNLKGDARHPYTCDGLTIYAYSSGYITINEANFFIIPQTLEGKEPYLAFFGGRKNKDHYDYLSISGVSDTLFGKTCEKYTVFTPTYVMYLRKYRSLLYALKVGINKKKEIMFSLEVVNTSNKPEEVYLSTYINALLTHSNYESEETKWFRNVSLNEKGCIFHSVEDLSRSEHLHNYCVLDSALEGEIQRTSSRMYYVGDKNSQVTTSTSLLNGNIKERREISQFIDMAAYGDICKKILNKNESLKCEYRLTIRYSDEELYTLPFISNDDDFNFLEEDYLRNVKRSKDHLSIKFKDMENISDNLFNSFVNQVIGQVDYCSKAKNSSLMLLGVRDISQMLDASLIWNHHLAKKRLIAIFNLIDPSGRAPRQVSSPKEEKNPLMDNREFIDQGQWLISTVHRYISYTSNYSFLKEKCTYCELEGRNKGHITDYKTIILEHLERIIGFLINNIDKDTGCLKTLYGDWNDAVDGLGTSKTNERFGNGVSIMATFHLYKNLNEIIDILRHEGKDTAYYESIREELIKSIKKYAIKDDHILHGWGENQSFYVGSRHDIDGKDRYSATSAAFYVISGYYDLDPSYKDLVIKAYRVLDSKYGVRTFNEPFYPESGSEVGRIVNLPPGTAENAATYIHGAMFLTYALMMMGEGNEAYRQLLKLIPITHSFISTSPFVMPNSYGYNPDLGIDGQSMNDWYTGSSNTLLKVIVDSVLGINPSYNDELILKPNKIPVKEINAKISVKGKRINIHYVTTNEAKYIKVNGNILNGNVINLKKIDTNSVLIEMSL